jgi:hypothetical protein
MLTSHQLSAKLRKSSALGVLYPNKGENTHACKICHQQLAKQGEQYISNEENNKATSQKFAGRGT